MTSRVLAAYPAAPPSFLARDALVVARALVGAFVVRRTSAGERVVRIVETEAYRGPGDAACHARVGLTERTRTLLGAPGHAYVFLVYGMHDCFNVVCGKKAAGHAVLVRAGEPVLGVPPGVRCDGPGRLSRALSITRSDDGVSLSSVSARSIRVSPRQRRVLIGVSARVGVAYAGRYADKPWRFFDRDSPYVSKPPARAIGGGEPSPDYGDQTMNRTVPASPSKRRRGASAG